MKDIHNSFNDSLRDNPLPPPYKKACNDAISKSHRFRFVVSDIKFSLDKITKSKHDYTLQFTTWGAMTENQISKLMMYVYNLRKLKD